MSVREAVCLLSGGLDSATALYVARRDGYLPAALTIHYGQLHIRELESAAKIAKHLGIQHEVISIELPWGGSALLDPKIPIPENRTQDEISTGIPPTYVPARNTVFLSLAASFAEARGSEAIFIGANALDFSGYPDCRPEYLEAFSAMIECGTKAGQEGRAIKVTAPLLRMDKKEIILLGRSLGVPFENTWSCYQGRENPCQVCDSCLLRAKGFREAGFEDPILSSLRGSEATEAISEPGLLRRPSASSQ